MRIIGLRKLQIGQRQGMPAGVVLKHLELTIGPFFGALQTASSVTTRAGMLLPWQLPTYLELELGPAAIKKLCASRSSSLGFLDAGVRHIHGGRRREGGRSEADWIGSVES